MQRLPDDLLRVVVSFSVDCLRSLLRLRLVNTQFGRVVRSPSMVSHLPLTLMYCRANAPSVLVEDDCYRAIPDHVLGWLATGMHYVSIHDATPGSCLETRLKTWCNLRSLKLFHSVVHELDLSSTVETMALDSSCVANQPCNVSCRVLRVSFCDVFDHDCIARMTGIESLKLERMTAEAIGFVQPLTSLHSFSLSECAHLTDVSGLAGLSLRKLKLEYCPLLSDIGSVLRLTQLDVLKVLECHSISNHDLQLAVDQLSKLSQLWIRHHHITSLSLSKLPHLTCVRLFDCVDLADLRGLPAGLLELNLESCGRIRDFSELDALVNLRDLNVCDCQIAELPKLPALCELNVSHCDNLTDEGLSNVFPCPQLQCLIMHDCTSVTDRQRSRLNGLVPSVLG